MNVNGQLVETLNASETFQNYERAYTEATGMPLTLRPAESWQLPFHDKRKENIFCAVMARNRACTACLRLQEKLTQDAMNQPATRTCAYGLCETAVPVKFGSRTIGFLQTGQVMRQKPTEAAFRRAVVQARKFGVDIGDDLTKRAYFESPVVSRRKLDSVTSLLVIFADHLSMKGNQIMVQTANAESPVIARAKQFIAGHYTEDISLCQVAKTVNTSVFYFCKQFRKATGLSFTEFVSRTRIEKAKNLLLNPNLHITEIAYAIGFQSLTQFNRTFKKIMGQSPTDYRGNLPAVI